MRVWWLVPVVLALIAAVALEAVVSGDYEFLLQMAGGIAGAPLGYLVALRGRVAFASRQFFALTAISVVVWIVSLAVSQMGTFWWYLSSFLWVGVPAFIVFVAIESHEPQRKD